MLMLRLSRAGSKKRPVYHLVAADKRSRRDGRFIENLGYYWPSRDILVLKQDRIDHWMSVGAQMTETARALIKKARKNGNTPPKGKPAPVPAPAPKVEAKPEAKPAPAPAEAPAPEAPKVEGETPAADA